MEISLASEKVGGRIGSKRTMTQAELVDENTTLSVHNTIEGTDAACERAGSGKVRRKGEIERMASSHDGKESSQRGPPEENAEDGMVAEEEDSQSTVNEPGVTPARSLVNYNGDDSQFEAGVILRVKMKDFMCHRMFDIELGRRVNFITGQNGSGMCLL